MSRKHTNTDIPEAVRWFNRFHENGSTALSPDESAQWAQWSADPENLADFQLTRQLWEDFGALPNIPRPTQSDLESDDYDPDRWSVSEWLARGKRRKTKR